MGHQNHVIQKQVLQIDIASAEKAKAAQNELSRIYRHRLQDLIDEILEAANVGDTVLRFDQLVLTCHYSQIDDLEKVLVKAVKEQLPGLLKSKPETASEAPLKANQNIALLDLLHHFLLKGSLPWWADNKDDGLDQWVQQLLQEKPELLLQRLQSLTANHSAMARLNFQLSTAVKKKLLQWMLKKEATRVHQSIQFLRSNWPKKNRSFWRADISLILEQSLLAYALQYSDQEFHSDKLLAILWGFLPAHLSSQKEQIALSFIQKTEDAPQARNWATAFQSVLPSAYNKVTESHFSSESTLENFQQLRCFIQKGYWPGPTNQRPLEMDVWLITFCRQHQKTARQQIPALIAEEKHFQRFVQSLSTTTLELLTKELLFEVSQEKIDFIPDLLEVMQQLFQGKHSRDSFHRQLETALFRYLIFHQPVQLQAQSVLAFLLKEMARFIPVDLEILKVKTATKAQELNKTQAFKSLLMVLLEPLNQKIQAQNQEGSSEHSEEEILWHFLKTGRFPQGVSNFNLEKLELIFHQLLQRPSSDFIKKLRQSLSVPNQPDRFQKQFSKTLIQKVALLFQGPVKEKAALLQQDLQSLFKDLFGTQHGAAAIAQCLDMALLRYFVRHRQTQLQATHLLFFILQQFSRFVPIALDDLILKTQTAVGQLGERQNFKSPLPDLLLQLEVSTVHNTAKNPSDYTGEALLFFFIKTGHLPAEKMDVSLDELSATFHALLENPRPGLARQLRQLLNAPHHLERFQQQFSVELMAKVSSLLQGLLSVNVQKYQEDLQTLFFELHQGSHHQKAIEKHLTFSLLRYFVLHQPTVLQPLSLLTFILESFARFVPVDYATLVASSKETVERLDRRMPFKSPLVGLLNQLHKELSSKTNSSVFALTEDLIFWQFLEKGILPEGIVMNVDLEKYLKQLLKKNDTSFLQHLRQSLSQSNAMDRLVNQFSPELLPLVSIGLQGNLQGKIKNYREELKEIFYPICRGKYSELELEQHLELSVLHFFIHGQHTPFQPLRMVAFLLEAFARFIPLNPESLLKQANILAQDLDKQRSFKSPVVALLAQLKKEKNKAPEYSQTPEDSTTILFYFLENGHWPQQTNASIAQNPEVFLNSLLKKADNKFIQKLQATLANPRHLENFQKEFSTDNIAQVAALFQESHRTKIVAFQEDLQLVICQLYQSQFSAAVIERQLQLSILRYFVKPPQQQFQAAAFLRFVLKEFARFVPVDFENLKQSVITTVQQLDQTRAFKSPIVGLLAQWKKGQENTPLAQEYHSEEEGFFYFIENGHWSQHTDASSVQNPEVFLNSLLKKADTQFIQKLQATLANPRHLENFQKEFSTDNIAQVVALFQESHRTKIAAFQEDLQLVICQLYQSQFSAAVIERQLQLSILRYFVKPPQQQFQAATFLRFVLKEFARFVPVDFENLKQSVIATARQLDQTRAFKSPIVALSSQWITFQKELNQSLKLLDGKSGVLFYLLENGKMPEEYQTTSTTEIVSFLNALLEKRTPAFVQQLRQALQSKKAVDHLFQHFPEKAISRITEIFLGTFATKVQHYHQDLQTIFHSLYRQQYGAAAIDRQLTNSLLRYAVDLPKKQLNPLELMSTLLENFSHFVSVDYAELKKVTKEKAKQLDRQIRFKSPVVDLLNQGIRSDKPTINEVLIPQPDPSASTVKKEGSEAEKFDRECQKLSSFPEKATPLVDAFWYLLKYEGQSWWLDSDIDWEQLVETLSLQHPDILKQQLSLAWESPDLSQRLLQRLSVSGIQQLAKTITGNSDTLILDYTELVWLYLATSPSADWQKIIPSRTHLLQRVFKEPLQQASFSIADFIHNCSQNLAKLLNIRPEKLLVILQESAATLAPQSGNSLGKLYELLSEAAEHFQNENTDDTISLTIEEVEEVSFLMEEMDWQQARKRTVLEEFEILRYFLYFGSFRPDYPVYTEEAFEQMLLRLMEQHSAVAKKLLKQLFRRPTAIERLVTHFSEKVVPQFLQLFFPDQQKQLQSDWKILVVLFNKLAPEKRKHDWMRLLQSQLMQCAAVVKNTQVPFNDYLPKVVATLAQRSGQKREVLMKNLQQEVRKNGTLISQPMKEAIHNWGKTKKQHSNNQKNIWEKMAEESIQLEDAVYIHNAGLAIISPFLPRYFKMLDMLEDGIFKNEEAAIRAVHLLQYLVTGQSETAEHFLVFNKILCGLPLETPVPLGIELSAQEIETSESMLQAIIQNWGKLNSTTIEGLRGGFLVRDAKITEAEKYWAIDVENKAYDVLLDTLPWSISIIKHSWIPKRIQINWR